MMRLMRWNFGHQMMLANEFLEIKIEIENIKEYLSNEVCKKCEELSKRLVECEAQLYEYSRKNRDSEK